MSSSMQRNPGVPAPGVLVFILSCLVHHADVIRGATAISPAGVALDTQVRRPSVPPRITPPGPRLGAALSW